MSVASKEHRDSIKIRYYSNADGDQVRNLFKTALSVGDDSPLKHLFRHELTSLRALASYVAVTLGLTASFASRAYEATSSTQFQLLAAIFLAVGLVPFLTRILSVYKAFMAFVNGSVGGPDMQDIPRVYGMAPDPSNDGLLVPYGTNAFWVAEVMVPDGSGFKSEIVGCVGLDINASPGTTDAELRRMAVSSKYRGRGIARDLIQRLIVHAKKSGLERVWLRTPTSNVGALKVYEKMGFCLEQEAAPFRGLETNVLGLDVQKS